MSKLKKIDIQDTIISITSIHKEDYICLTDMAKAKQGSKRAADVIKNWIRPELLLNFWELGRIKFGRNLWPLIIAHCLLNSISMAGRVF